jgi:hypothetical protein
VAEAGLSAAEAGEALGEHAKHAAHHEHDRSIMVAEAAILAIVTLVAAWSGFSAARWGTESSLKLAKASATRSEANREFQQALTYRVGDGLTMNAWLAAHQTGDPNAMRIAERRFLPELKVAFDAWIKTDPFTNPNAPPGPQSMPQYHAKGQLEAAKLDKQADDYYAEGQHAGHTEDDYIRVTVVLASVLFLVGISTHFRMRGVRIGLVGVGAVLLIFAAVQIVILPLAP